MNSRRRWKEQLVEVHADVYYVIKSHLVTNECIARETMVSGYDVIQRVIYM